MSSQIVVSEFRQKYAFTLAHARLVNYLSQHPDAKLEEIESTFASYVEGALGAAAAYDYVPPVDPELLV